MRGKLIRVKENAKAWNFAVEETKYFTVYINIMSSTKEAY